QVQGEDSLHRAFAVAGSSHDSAAAEVADGAGKNLAGAGAVAVDQHDQRHTPRSRLAGRVGVVFLTAAATGGDDRAAIDELVDHLDGRVEKPARITSQVDDQ